MYKKSSCGISMYTPGVIPEELRESFGNACELVCVQIPKVYDSCLLRLCLVGDQDKANEEEGIEFDKDLRVRIDCCVDGIVNARVVGLVPGSFKIISKREVPGDCDRKIICYTYELKILYDIVCEDGTICKDEVLCLRRSECVGPLYCPDSETIIREQQGDRRHHHHHRDDPIDEEIIKLEIIAKVLDVKIELEECPCDPYEDECFAVFTVGIYNIVKCELVVQLVIPAFGFCPPPKPCEKMGEPCEIFNSQLPPAFFPPQLDDFITGPCV
ncbi:hypothetical protein [Anaeromicrobium sediminis]|uniref:Uncharacterized protein n=1 Tax=Anaeromicrobium sediminis TaxID=1478221 RepID=A0A267MNE0_9FIRM|nr:hypothetical protein [Anaeromicrobium sediminis]PAB60912.1 hypothetical protein CCE28_00315 [Anaeromicrobium sediminis]